MQQNQLRHCLQIIGKCDAWLVKNYIMKKLIGWIQNIIFLCFFKNLKFMIKFVSELIKNLNDVIFNQYLRSLFRLTMCTICCYHSKKRTTSLLCQWRCSYLPIHYRRSTTQRRNYSAVSSSRWRQSVTWKQIYMMESCYISRLAIL